VSIRHPKFEDWLLEHYGGDVEILMEAINADHAECVQAQQMADDLACGIRMLKAYPKSREGRIDKLLAYCRKAGYGGSPLRAEETQP
jgi:hypothetical protein